MNAQLVANVVFGIAVVVWIASRQLRWRPVTERSYTPLVLIAVGLFQSARLASLTAVPAGDWWVLLASAALGAGLAAWRAQTVQLRSDEAGASRRGTWLTVTLWVVGLGQHLCSEFFLHTPGLGQLSLLAYLGVVALVQRELVLLRVQEAGLLPQRRGERGARALR